MNELMMIEEAVVVNSDVLAEETIAKIAELRKEKKRLVDVCEAMIEQYRSRIAEYNEHFEEEELRFSRSLEAYFETVDRKKTKTQESYVLPSGLLKKKYQQPEIVKDDLILLEWAKESAKQHIKVKESVDWATLKKDVTLQDGKAITVDGEVVEGITIIERSPKFIIETEI